MAFRLNSKITITQSSLAAKTIAVNANAVSNLGGTNLAAVLGTPKPKTYTFSGVNNIHISSSIYSFTDLCTIKVPTTYRLVQTGIGGTEGSVIESAPFAVGDSVNVQLGYNGKYNTEFIGFIIRLNFTTPLEIECEGYSYQLRTNLTPISFTNTTLKNILKYVIQGTDITLSPNIPDMPVTKYIIFSETGAQVLEKMKHDLLLTIYFTANELYAGLTYADDKKQTVTLRLGWNTIKNDQLKKVLNTDYNVQINYIGIKNDGTKITATAGNSANIKRHKTYSVTDSETLQAMANTQLLKETFNGYKGKITFFGEPFCQKMWVVNLQDPKYSEREGKYLIDSLEVSYGVNGFRRIAGISIEI